MSSTLRKYTFIADKAGNVVTVEVREISITRAEKEALRVLESSDYHLTLVKIQGEGL